VQDAIHFLLGEQVEHGQFDEVRVPKRPCRCVPGGDAGVAGTVAGEDGPSLLEQECASRSQFRDQPPKRVLRLRSGYGIQRPAWLRRHQLRQGTTVLEPLVDGRSCRRRHPATLLDVQRVDRLPFEQGPEPEGPLPHPGLPPACHGGRAVTLDRPHGPAARTDIAVVAISRSDTLPRRTGSRAARPSHRARSNQPGRIGRSVLCTVLTSRTRRDANIRRSDSLPQRWERPHCDRQKGRESLSEYSGTCMDIRAGNLLISADGYVRVAVRLVKPAWVSAALRWVRPSPGPSRRRRVAGRG